MYWKVPCPTCGKPVDYQTMHIRTGLGPRVVLCSRCGTRVASARFEWAEFGPGRKFLYWLLSTCYAALGGAMGAVLGLTVQMNVRAWTGKAPLPPEWPSWYAVAFGAVSFAAVMGVQAYRVRCSRKRSNGASGPAVTSDFRNLQVNLQYKMPAAFLALWLWAAAPLAVKSALDWFLKG